MQIALTLLLIPAGLLGILFLLLGGRAARHAHAGTSLSVLRDPSVWLSQARAARVLDPTGTGLAMRARRVIVLFALYCLFLAILLFVIAPQAPAIAF